MNGWMDGCMDEWMDGQRKVYRNRYMYSLTDSDSDTLVFELTHQKESNIYSSVIWDR